MSTSTTCCPHCGKPLSSPDKLGWHLTRECPALIEITTVDSKAASKATQTKGR